MENKKPYSNLYFQVTKEINNSKYINIQKLMYLISYSKSGFYNENLENNIIDDFITSPLISSFFGYFIGFFLYLKWKKFFYKKKIDLIELGPGNGKFLYDILNFLKETEMFEFIEKIKLVEYNKFLNKIQNEKLKDFSSKIEFYTDFGLIKIDKPFFIFSNEFFDCLPLNQFIFKNEEWNEIVLYFNELTNEFEFGLTKKPSNNLFLLKEMEDFQEKENKIFEISSQLINICREINNLLNEYSGLNLIIDYGFLKNEYKSSLQCIKNHKNQSISDCIKFSGDISAHVNFDHIQKIFLKNKNLKEDSFETFLCEQHEFFEKILNDFNLEFENPICKDMELKIQSFLSEKNSQNSIGKLFKVFYFMKN